MTHPFRLCSHTAKACATKASEKAHYFYLVTATLVDGHLLLRVATGGCLVFCLLGELLKDEEMA